MFITIMPGGIILTNRSGTEEKKNLKQQAYETIKAKILNCEYAPNEFINEQILCNELGSVSRTPIRDAVGRLEQEGLVSILPKKGILVAPLNLVEINLIYEVRLLLEPYALLHYGDKIPPQDWMKFQQIIDNNPLKAKQSNRYFYEIDNQFHNRIVEATGNRYIINAFRDTQNTNHRIRILSGNEIITRVEETFQEHRAIISASLEQNWDKAARAMTAHLERSRTAAYQLLISNRPDISLPL